MRAFSVVLPVSLALLGCGKTSDVASDAGSAVAPACVDPASYPRSCATAADCVPVPGCNVQPTCRTCSDTAISASALPAFQAALAELPPPGAGGCGPCAMVVASCIDGGCAVVGGVESGDE